MVGLGNVNNTSDLLKPIATAIQAALNVLASSFIPTCTVPISGINYNLVGFGNLSNTSDINKPIPTATQTDSIKFKKVTLLVNQIISQQLL